jgi:hypothetical protein
MLGLEGGLSLADVSSTARPPHRLIGFDSVGDMPLHRSLQCSSQGIGTGDQQRVERIGDGRHYSGSIVGRLHPVAGCERVAQLLELPDGATRCLSIVLT